LDPERQPETAEVAQTAGGRRVFTVDFKREMVPEGDDAGLQPRVQRHGRGLRALTSWDSPYSCSPQHETWHPLRRWTFPCLSPPAPLARVLQERPARKIHPRWCALPPPRGGTLIRQTKFGPRWKHPVRISAISSTRAARRKTSCPHFGV